MVDANNTLNLGLITKNDALINKLDEFFLNNSSVADISAISPTIKASHFLNFDDYHSILIDVECLNECLDMILEWLMNDGCPPLIVVLEKQISKIERARLIESGYFDVWTVLDVEDANVEWRIIEKRLERLKKLKYREKDGNFRAFLEASFDAVFFESLSGEIIDFNNVALKMYGYTRQELLSKSVAELVPPEIAKSLTELAGVLDEKGGFFVEAAGVRKNGEVFPSEVNARLINFDNRPLVVVFVRDISQRKTAETEFRESQRKLMTLMSNLQGMAYRCLNNQNWDMEFVSEGCLDLTGYTQNELEQSRKISFGEIIHPDDRKLVRGLVQRSIEKQKPFQLAFRITTAQGGEKWIWEQGRAVYSNSGAVLALEGFATDISENKRTEVELRKWAEKLKLLHKIDQELMAERAPSRIAQMTLHRLSELTSCKFAWITLSGESEKEHVVLATNRESNGSLTIGKKFNLSSSELLILAENPEHERTDLKITPRLSEMQKAAMEDGVMHHVFFPIRNRSDIIGALSMGFENENQIKLEDLEFVNEIAVSLAIVFHQAKLYEKTQNYALDLERRVLERTHKLQEVNTELETFIFSVTHDLRSPLRAIQGFARALVEDYHNVFDSTAVEYSQRIFGAAERMDRLIKDLLEYSRINRIDLDLEAFNMNRIVSEVILQLEVEIEEKHALIEVNKPLGVVLGQQSILLQIMHNLISNALKFVKGENIPKVKVWSETRGMYVRIWVEDNGIGIAHEDQERIFRIFERLHPEESYAGTGIGLAIVRRSIERLEGQFGLISTLGEGSKFWVELFASKGLSA